MADKKQLAILKRDRKVWNTWRKKKVYVYLSLDYADLGKANLAKANLDRANLRGTNLGKANLRDTDLNHALLEKTNFRAVPKTKMLIYLAFVSGGDVQEGGFGAVAKLRMGEWCHTDDYSSGENGPPSVGWSFRHGS